MTTATEYVSYSVGAYAHNGREVGREFSTIERARDYLTWLEDSGRVASAVLYGWTADGECEELDGFAA